jgi:hypothetical protein
MNLRTTGYSAAFVLALLGSQAAQPAPVTLTGSVAGVVSNTFGVPQMGATVILLNRLEKQVARVLTDDRGTFQFDALPSDMYTVRVTLASFVPALRNNIGVQPGVRKVLSINMAGLLSSIELVYSLPLQQGLMTDDWKWTLRGSHATRPILRVLAVKTADPLERYREGSNFFSQTRGVLKLSAGDSTQAPTLGSQPDLGTAFALATSIYGRTNVEVSGNLGYAHSSGNPAAGFRTSFSRQFGETRSPEVAVTMRQIFLGGRAGSAMIGGQPSSAPTFRSMAFSLNDRVQVDDHLLLSYGATLESVQFLQPLNYMSHFARLSYDMGPFGVLEFGYSSGLPPTQLYSSKTGHLEDEPQQEISGLAMFPRVSVRDGHARVQRAKNYEIGAHKKVGSRTYSAAFYRESFTNAALTAVGAEGAFAGPDLLPDMFSTSAVFNAGSFQSVGYVGAVAQELGDQWTATLGYGNSGVLEAGSDRLRTNDADELRSLLRPQRRHWATLKLAGHFRATGTRFTTGYQFMNGSAVTPGHFYMTQTLNPERGLNVQVRQPIPSFNGLPGKVEATAEIRNILAQGYQPIYLQNGQVMRLVHSPRALRGGLAFIF